MRLFLDTEFNGFGGELISMALIAEDGHEWYEVLPHPDNPEEFVQEHVLPKLRKDAIHPVDFQVSLMGFLEDFKGCEIVADWPADFEHLCAQFSIHGRYLDFTLPMECTMRLINTPELHPEIPHNALSDAKALRKWCMQWMS